ncbi:MAG: NADH-quinone oxidoreductase subunit M [Phycisphaerae bacterium]|nr:NADH-quinone oxidoreductase subunit M [Phycisphaerae bacterium]
MLDAFGVNLLIFLPLLAAVIICFMPERLVSRFALAIGGVTFVVALGLWLRLPAAMAAGDEGWALVGECQAEWIAVGEKDPDTGRVINNGVVLSYHVGFDAISLPLVVLTGLLVPLSVWCSFNAIRTRQREYYAWLLALTTGMFGVFAARDLLLFYIFFEFTLVPLYFLIGIWGGPERRWAATKFFIYTFVGSVLTFAGIMYLAIRAAQIEHLSVITFDLRLLSALTELTTAEQSLLFIAFFCGFAIKVPFFPLHTWLPLAHTEAPTAGSVLLAGVLLKLGTYGFLRFSLPMVPEGALAWAHPMGVLAIAGIIYGALCCWVQRDVKKLVAYSSVSHLGFCMLGMFSLLPIGLSGSVLYMINHGISTGALFLVVGMIYERYHTRDLEQIGGLARKMPIMAFFFVLFVLSSIGLPGLNGFVSEFTVLFAAYNSEILGRWYGVLGATGILLGAIYMLYAVGKVLFGPVKEPEGTPDLSTGLKPDLNAREIAILTPLAILVVLLGVAPRIITDTLDPALEVQVLARVRNVADSGEGVTGVAHRFSGGGHEFLDGSDTPTDPPPLKRWATQIDDNSLADEDAPLAAGDTQFIEGGH